MKSGFSLGAGGVVARSLKMTRATHVLVAAPTGAVAANVMVAMQFIGLSGQLALLALIFASVSAATLAISADVFTRSSQTVSNLRSIGASTRSLSGAMLGVALTWGLAGAAVGACLGAVLGVGLAGTSGPALSLLAEAAEVLVASAGAMTAGVYFGASLAWHS